MVEGAQSEDMMKNAKRFRVLYDGLAEDVNHWTAKDRKSMPNRKRMRGAAAQSNGPRRTRRLSFSGILPTHISTC